MIAFCSRLRLLLWVQWYFVCLWTFWCYRFQSMFSQSETHIPIVCMIPVYCFFTLDLEEIIMMRGSQLFFEKLIGYLGLHDDGCIPEDVIEGRRRRWGKYRRTRWRECCGLSSDDVREGIGRLRDDGIRWVVGEGRGRECTCVAWRLNKPNTRIPAKDFHYLYHYSYIYICMRVHNGKHGYKL